MKGGDAKSYFGGGLFMAIYDNKKYFSRDSVAFDHHFFHADVTR